MIIYSIYPSKIYHILTLAEPPPPLLSLILTHHYFKDSIASSIFYHARKFSKGCILFSYFRELSSFYSPFNQNILPAFRAFQNYSD